MTSSYKRGDYFNKKAKKAGLPARSVFKLEEIDHRFNLVNQGQHVIDLGAAPGSWSRYVITKIGKSGVLHAYDIQDFKLPPQPAHVYCHVVNVLQQPVQDFPKQVHLVLSDMAPSTTGDGFSDAAKSHELAYRVLDIAKHSLVNNGHMVCKLLEGEETKPFQVEMKKYFQQTKFFRPKATRSFSREIFIIGKNWQGEIHES